MAEIDELIAEVSDDTLRAQLRGAAARLRVQRRFGLVFEEHIPENILLSTAGISVGSTVVRRDEPSNKHRYLVTSITDGKAILVTGRGNETESVTADDLLVVKPFGEPIYPVLTTVGKVERGGDKPYHTVINGENFHALQLLLFQYECQVDFNLP